MGLMGVHSNPLLDGSDEDLPQSTQQQQQQQRVKRSRTDSSVASTAAKPHQEKLPTKDSSCAAAAPAADSLLNGAAAATKATAHPAAASAAAASVCPISGNVVRDGDLVVLRDFAGRRSLARSQRDAASCDDACGSRFSLDLSLLPGSPFGSTFSWDGCCWRRSKRADKNILHQAVLGEECLTGSNRDIVDCGDSQRLSASEIEALKGRASAADAIREVSISSSNSSSSNSSSSSRGFVAEEGGSKSPIKVLDLELRGQQQQQQQQQRQQRQIVRSSNSTSSTRKSSSSSSSSSRDG
ncbi:hypothetical protein Emed_004023 [Eimeria media]